MSKQPNVIYILVDDMGYGDFAAFNGGITDTPSLSRMVEEGVTLSECYSSSPVCAPARASILTGRYPQRTGVIDTLETRGLDRLKLTETTMSQVFRQGGYTTGLIGKWHLGAVGEEYHPNKRGFDYFMGFRGGWCDYYDYHIQRNGEFLPCTGQYLTDVFTEDSIRFIKDNKDRPFFLHLAYNAPHFPHQAPQELVDKYKATGKYTDAVSTIYAMIECVDTGVGKILKTLEEEGLDQDTLVIFTSDNGPEMEAPGDYDTSMLSSVRFNCDLRGQKCLVYEGGIKIPAVLRWPGQLALGQRCDQVIHHTDWLPTLMTLCGLSFPKELALDGMDVTPALRGGQLPERTLCWQWNRFRPALEGNAAIRHGAWKLVHPPIPEHLALQRFDVALDEDIKAHPQLYTDIVPLPARLPDVPPQASQLFHLSQDPCEKEDRLDREPVVAQDLETRLQAWFEEVEAERMLETKN